MDDIRSLLKVAARRLELSSFLARLHWVAVFVSALALVLMIADRLPAEAFLPWLWVGCAMVLVSVLIATIWWSVRRRSELQVAIEVDDRLQLREKLSTALHVQKRTDAFARAAIEDAVNTARDARTRERTRRLFGITPPPGWWASPLVLLATIMLSFLAPLDLFSEDPDDQPAAQEAKLEADTSIEAVVKAIEDKPELSGELSDLLGELTKEQTDFGAERSPEQIRRDAIKKVGEIERRLDEIVNGEQGRTMDALERALRQLDRTDGPAKDLADALAKGDFSAAKKALEELMAKADNGQLNEEQKEKLAQQLEQMAQQLQKLAEQKQQLEEALKAAGLDPQLANNPQALEQALQQNRQNLNQQQLQQLQQMAQAQQAANQMCQGLGQACQAMAQNIMNGQMGPGGQQMGDQLDAMEQMQMMLQQAQAAMNQCQGMCQGLGQGLALKPGGAFGNRGQGAGGKAPLAPTPTGTRLIKADVKTTEGDIIARQLIDGPAFVGESNKRRTQIVAEIMEGFDEGIAEDQLPRRYHEAHMHYFGELEKLARTVETADETTDESESETPAAEDEGSGD